MLPSETEPTTPNEVSDLRQGECYACNYDVIVIIVRARDSLYCMARVVVFYNAACKIMVQCWL